MPGYPLPLVVFGVPVRGKSNPYLVAVSRDPLVSVEVELEEADKPRVRVEGVPEPGWRLTIPLTSFLDVVSDRLEQPLEARVYYRVEGVVYPPSASLYAIITYELVRTLAEAGGYTMSEDEIVKAASSVDSDAGVELDYVNAMRTALARKGVLVYREGEEPVPLELGFTLELVGEEDAGEPPELGEPVVNAVTRLAGISVVDAVSRLKGGEPFDRVFDLASRVDNALYYLLYSLQPPGEGCKWTPSISAGYGVCREGMGRGDRLRFG